MSGSSSCPATADGTLRLERPRQWTGPLDGQYQVNGSGRWYPVSGTATTTSTPFLSHVVEARTHLVQDSLD